MLGIDLVYLPEFKERITDSLLDKVFLPVELSQNKSQESLAGIFGAKEAFFKAIGKKENWLEVWIEKDQHGKPSLVSTLTKAKTQVSISHAGEYVVAIVMIKDK